MIRRLLALAALPAMLCSAAPALAEGNPDQDFRQIAARETFALKADRAYLLLRIDTDLFAFSADIMRVPGADEIASYQAARSAAYSKAGAKAGPLESFNFKYEGRPNLFAIMPGKAIASSGKIKTTLVEVVPGDYVVYGLGMREYLYECFCLGTVGFTAEAGKITDLGTLLTAKAWQPSPIPELKDETGLGRSADMDLGLFAVAVRRAEAGIPLPPGINPALVQPASFHAVASFVEPNTTLINRLAAMPEVLSYENGRIVDAKSGRKLD
ncbi:hypothetical protein [Novosphingobium sp.]|uniref:hypothetical protein n=1 Tax=Novosphingobium sp. TaxID=1874826 RepID=UPI00333E23ED